jgi:cobalt-zinc-cadmium efflux system protein
MGHSHSHDSIRNIKVAFFLNLFFTILEIIGGFWTNSLAILSDALHDLGDSFSLGLSWYLEKFSKREKDKLFSYGYRRFSLLAALINTVILVAGSLFILSEAIPRIFKPEHSNAQGMVLFAIFGVLINGVAALRLKGDKSLNAQVIIWHFMEDVLGWIAVLIVGIIMLFKDIHFLDPALSIMITLYVLYNVIGKLKKTLAIFLQAVPENINIDEVENRLAAIDKVKSVHHTHVWSMDGEHHVLTTHIVVDEEATKDDVLQVKCSIKQLTDDMEFSHTTAEIEYGDEMCRMQSDKK